MDLKKKLFIIAGVVYAHSYFPGLSSVQATFGGIVIGLFGVLCGASHTVIWGRNSSES